MKNLDASKENDMNTTTLPKARTFRMVLEVLEKRRATRRHAWRQEPQFICHVIRDLKKCERITAAEDACAIAYIDRMLQPQTALADWLADQGYVEVYCGRGKINDHRIEWVKRIIKELS